MASLTLDRASLRARLSLHKAIQRAMSHALCMANNTRPLLARLSALTLSLFPYPAHIPRSDFRFSSPPLVKLERNAAPQSARPGYNMQRQVTSPYPTSLSTGRAHVASRTKSDDGVRESTRMIERMTRYLKLEEESEQKGKLVLASPSKRGIDSKQAKLRPDELYLTRNILQTTGLLSEIHTVFTKGVCAVAENHPLRPSASDHPLRLSPLTILCDHTLCCNPLLSPPTLSLPTRHTLPSSTLPTAFPLSVSQLTETPTEPST